MPTDFVRRQDLGNELDGRNRKVLLAIFAVIGLLVVVSVITILVKN